MDRSWRVLLIGGSSGTGKTRITEQIGKSLGLPWMQVDDLRMALQHSDVRLPARTDDLYYFVRTPEVWQRSPQELCNGLIGVGRVMQVPLEMVIDHYVGLNFPIVIEGDGILPSILSRPLVTGLAPLVRAVFIVEPDEAVLSRNIAERGRHVAAPSAGGLMRETPYELALRSVACPICHAVRVAGGLPATVGDVGRPCARGHRGSYS